MRCDFIDCYRTATHDDGLCYGHYVITRQHKESRGDDGLLTKEYLDLIRPAIEWLINNPNPHERYYEFE